MATKGFRRKLTPFLCQEMLYDYEMGHLDPDRHTAVEEFLRTDKECQDLLEAIRRGNEYSCALAAAGLRPEILEQLKDSENALSLGRRYSTWSAWPDSMRWSITAIAISVVVAAIVAVVPWDKLRLVDEGPRDTIEIAKLPGLNEEQLRKLQESDEVPAPSAADEVGEHHDDEETPIDRLNPEDRAKLVKQMEQQENDGHRHAAPPVAVNVAAGAPKLAKNNFAAAKAEPIVIGDSSGDAEHGSGDETHAAAGVAAVDSEPTPSPSRKDAKPRGFVYRAFMNLSNLDEVAPKITAQLKELGGEKAGEVELGWKRGTGRYYHFSLPEENEEKALEQLRVYGPVRISKDPHPRIMPQGQVRFILWIEAAN